MFKYIDNPNGDLFCLFTEAGLELLNDTGEMIYIIPSSFNNIKSASKLRRYIYGNNLLKYYDEILDENLFNKALVYVSIYTFSKNKKDDAVFYTTVDESDILFKQAFLDIDDIYVDGNFIFSNKNVLSLMNEIRKCNKKYIKVKNGLVTTKNTFFIKDEFDFNEYIIKVTKGNFGNGKVWEKCFYPYDENGKIIPYEELIKNENIKKYIEENKDELLSRPNISEETFYGFGKTQGLPDTYKEKISISKMSNGSIHGIFSPSATHNLSNLYIISNSEYSISEIITMLNRQINNMIYTNDIYVQKPQNLKFNDVFISMNDIVKTIGKRRANGYYSIEGKPMENFLNYLIDKEIKETKKKQN